MTLAKLPTMTESHWEALCWGGPLDGQWIASPNTWLDAVRHKPIRWDEAAPDTTIPYFVDRYNYERVAFRPLMFGAWVIQQPAERREAAMQTITDGLNAIYGMSLLLGDWRS